MDVRRADDARPARAPLPPGLVLLVGVAAMSYAGPAVRFSSAPALVIAAWRLTFSVAFIALVLAFRPGAWRSVRLGAGEWLQAVAAGLLLAAHFWSWIASLSLTTVSSSVVLVSTQPIFVALLSTLFLHERATARQWLGIVIAVTGGMVIGWGDFGQGRAALIGDLLATAGAVFVSGYYVIGRSLRQKLDLWLYIGIVYGVAAASFMVLGALHPHVSLTGYPARDWLIFAALAAGPMMLGHTGVNYALRYLRAYVANLALLGEPIGATLIAWLLPAIHEVPGPQTLIGAVLILGGIALGVIRQAQTGRGPQSDRQRHAAGCNRGASEHVIDESGHGPNMTVQ
ncbi:MAG: DMT family transporter [Gemmatimonadetes bacterium]|nr:DMT family transporter [Gemmatimonadota bacterium]